jgi:hypothetical protein
MTFMRGQSGNPGGRPNSTIRELARQHSKEAVETLAKIMKASHSDRARILAANSLLDRAWGRPTQPIGGDPEEPLVLHEHRAAILAEVLRIAAARGGGGEGGDADGAAGGGGPVRLGPDQGA